MRINVIRYSLFLILTIGTANSQMVPFAFFKRHGPSDPALVFTTTAQSHHQSLCSDVMTVEARDGSGSPDVQGSNLTVNLANGGGVTFYSDMTCLNSITSIVMATGTSSVSFYAMPTTTGTLSMTASATGYIDATQNLTGTTNPYIWTGGGANANWNTAANWSGGAYPGTGNYVVVFDGTCSSNCSPVLNIHVDLKGVRMVSPYSGTLTRSAGYNIITRAAGWVQQSGTVDLSAHAGNVTAIDGPFRLAGGTFSRSTGQFDVRSNTYFLQTGGTFNGSTGNCLQQGNFTVSGGTYHTGAGLNRFRIDFNVDDPSDYVATSGGTTHLYPTDPVNSVYNIDGLTFHDLHLQEARNVNGTATVNGTTTFNINGTGSGSATLNAHGDISLSNTGAITNARVYTLNLVGTSTQTITCTVAGSTPRLPHTFFNNTGPSVNFSCDHIMTSDDITVVEDNLNPGATELILYAFPGITPTWTFGTETWAKARWNIPVNTVNTITGTLKVSGDVDGRSGCCSVGTANGGTMEIGGSLLKTATNYHHPAVSGTLTYSLVGSNNTTWGNSAQVMVLGINTLNVNKTGGARIDMLGHVRQNHVGAVANILAGTIYMNGYTLEFKSLDLNGNTIYTGGGIFRVDGVQYASTPGTYNIFNGTVINP